MTRYNHIRTANALEKFAYVYKNAPITDSRMLRTLYHFLDAIKDDMTSPELPALYKFEDIVDQYYDDALENDGLDPLI